MSDTEDLRCEKKLFPDEQNYEHHSIVSRINFTADYFERLLL